MPLALHATSSELQCQALDAAAQGPDLGVRQVVALIVVQREAQPALILQHTSSCQSGGCKSCK